LEYTASERHNRRWRETVELSISKDDWNHNIIVIGSSSKKTRFQLDGNIKQIHTSNIKDGKVTISLSSPMVNIFIRNAIVENLTTFVKILQHAQKHSGDDLEEVAERWGVLKRKVTEVSSSSSDDEAASVDDEEG
jgi:hypothetical protein